MGKNVNLYRMARSDHGTEGILSTEDFSCKTLELPWRDNERQVSCIPSGEYNAEIRLSNKYGRIYWVRKVSNQTYSAVTWWFGDRTISKFLQQQGKKKAGKKDDGAPDSVF